ncbi:hypothetical protein REPUB_Repub08aG0102000 [Reevesia pubescens]
MILLALLLVFHDTEVGAVAAQDTCKVTGCKRHGPPVRFPFWLKDQQPNHWGYPDSGFELACTQSQQTLLHLPHSVQMLIEDIDYKAQRIHLSHPDGCLNSQLPSLNLSATPFKFTTDIYFGFKQLENLTLFNCSRNSEVVSFSVNENTCPIRAFPSDYGGSYSLLNCSKIVDIPAVPSGIINRVL